MFAVQSAKMNSISKWLKSVDWDFPIIFASFVQKLTYKLTKFPNIDSTL